MNELMNSIATFTNVDFGDVRVWMDENGTAWFFGEDVCRALGYSKPRDAIRNTVDEEDIRVYDKGTLSTVYTGAPNNMQKDGVYEKGTVPVLVAGFPNRMQANTEYLLVNEPGLYQLICRSRKPEAVEFLRWVTDEVIPSIRKHGLYISKEVLEDNGYDNSARR